MNLPLTENNSEEFGGIERRRHKRFKVKDDALVFLGKDTGTLLDISKGGVSVHYAALEQNPTIPKCLDIFFAQSRFYLPNLPVSLVAEAHVFPNPVFSSFQVKRLRMKFGPLSSDQQTRLDDFISQNTISDN